MTSFDDFKNEWLNRRIDYDHTLGYQCVDLIRQYFLECFGLAGGGGVPTAIAYWTNTPADVLTKFTRDGSGNVQKGDVIMLRTLGHSDYAGDGHIMIATGEGDPNSIEGLEQNGVGSGTGLGQDAIRTRFVPRNRLAGVLRPIVAPQVVRTPHDYMQYTTIPAKTMRANKLQTNWWNLSNDSDNIDNFSVAATLTVNTPFTIGGYAKNLHFPMYTYAMSPEDFNRASSGDFSTNNGINLADLEDIPYTPPAAPVVVPKVTTYDLVTSVVYWNNAASAKAKDQTAKGTLSKGSYILLKSDGSVRELAKKNTDTITYWINDFDNKIEEPIVIQPTLPVDPPPTKTEPVHMAQPTITDLNDWQATVNRPVVAKQPLQWGWINENHQPSLFQYQGRADMQVLDLEGNNPPIKMAPGMKKVISRYTMVGDKSYLLPDKEFTSGRAYGIEEDKGMVEIKKPTILDEIGGDLSQFFNYLETGFKSTARLITDISPVKISHAATRSKQVIDGYNAKRKVK